MKKITLSLCILFTSITSFSQSLGYQDLGILFSKDDLNGTARFEAMGGAFGAVGGDISTINVNPAGLAIFSLSSLSASFNSKSTTNTTSYYGNETTTKEQYFNLSNAGAVLVFKNPRAKNWNKFALGVNYRIKKDFSNRFFASGNSNVPTFREFPYDANDPVTQYDFSDQQTFSNIYNGNISEFSIALAAIHKEDLHVGAAINFLKLDFSQNSLLSEFNNDGNGNTLDATLYQTVSAFSEGFSINLGLIYKLSKNFRIGASYETPSWYTEVFEDSNLRFNDGFYGEVAINASNNNFPYANTSQRNSREGLVYALRTPGKMKASAAYIFGRSGLISIDYTRKNYQNINLSTLDLDNGNQFFQNNLRNAYALNLGTEWRFGLFSVRGGYTYEQSPFSNALKTDDVKGYSYGLGYNFGNFKLDVAFSDNSSTGVYNFYPQFDNINAAELNLNNKVFSATLSISL